MEIYHKDIYKKLDNFIESKQIPNIIFHGEHGSGKKTIMTNFLNKLYSHVDDYKQYIMYVNCAEGKGIRFIREELKFFAKTNIHNYGGSIVKSIILLNADFLTIDAQSALRRCIELFSNYTRFFIVIENKSKLIKPILSRFSSLHIYRPKIKRKVTDLHSIQNIKIPRHLYRKKRMAIKELFTLYDENTLTIDELIEHIDKIYEKGGSALDLIQYIDEHLEDCREKLDMLLYVEILKQEVRNESLLMFLVLNCYKMRNTNYLENINIL